MKRGINPVLVFTLGVIILLWLMWNHFQLPVFLWGQTGMVTGRVVDTLPVRAKRGVFQDVTYAYEVSGKHYIMEKRIGKSFPYQFVGNRVQIEYQISQPSRHKVKGFFSDYSKLNSTLESYRDSLGNVVTLKNGIVSLYPSSLSSKEDPSYGFGEWSKDTLRIKLINGEAKKLSIARAALRE